MKRIWLILFLGCTANRLLAQEPETAPSAPAAGTPSATALSQSIFLDVKDLGTNLSSDASWRSIWGSYSKNVTRARALEINLRNPAKLPGEYVVEWFFFAVPVKGGKRFLFDRESKGISLAPGASEKATVVSDELQSRSTHYAYDYYYYNTSNKSGTKPEGWIVTVASGGKIIRVKTSSAQLEALYKNTREFQATITPAKKNAFEN